MLAVDLLNRMCVQHETALIVVNNICSEALLRKMDKRVAVHKIQRREGSRNPWPLLKFNVLLAKLRPDIIHCHEPDIGRIIKSRVGKMVYTIHDTGIPTTYYHHFDALIAISDAVQQELSSRFDRPIKTVYNGIDTAHFRRRNVYKAENSKLKLVQLSRLMHEKKGQDLLLEALSLVKTHYGYENFLLDFVGGGASLDFLKELTGKLNLTDEVNFVGERDREWLFQNLSTYHLLVQPSRYEGFGLTILEGFAAGLPVLASNIEGPAEIINRTPRGFLFQKNNSQDCAEALYRIFKDYENGAIEEIMRSSAPITEKEYSIEVCVKGYLQEYSLLVK